MKGTALALTGLLAIALLAGCTDPSGPAGGTTPTTPAPPTSSSSTTSTTAPSTPPPSDSNTTTSTPGTTTGPGPAPPWVWPPLDSATIRPGVQMVADGAQCTSNFVYLDPQNTTVYLGFAAHCVGAGTDSTDTDGCSAGNPSLPLGTEVEVEGASNRARLVYSSWETMQRLGETDAGACDFNDFAVVALDPADAPRAHPAMLTFGGPTGMAGPVALGDKVLTFGNTGLRPGPTQLDAREGYVLFDDAWTSTVYTVTPGLPGDSGSGVMTGDGGALGILVTVALTPYAASNGITHLDKAMAYAASHGGPDLVLGTWEVLDPGLLPS